MNIKIRDIFMLACLLFWCLGVVQAAETDTPFDHFSTGFPLSGQHVRTACEACHMKGVFKGTPTQCSGCHNGSVAPGKTARHITSPNSCDDCHTTSTWSGGRMDHSTVTGACKSCHNGVQAPGMSASHLHTTSDCAECHGTLAWSPARFDHASTRFLLTGKHMNVECDACHAKGRYKGTPVQCSGCHTKNARHIVSSNNCEDCHTTRAWKPATFRHDNITGRCDACHNGSTRAKGKPSGHRQTVADCNACHNTNTWDFNHRTITGECSACHTKPNGHVPTTAECNACHHSTVTWSGAKFDHGNVTGGCAACHNGNTAIGMSGGHFVTARECNVCHRTTPPWTSLVFAHMSPNYPGNHHVGVTCVMCHVGNVEAVVWRSPQFKPDCAGCHAAKYVPGSHKKYEEPADVFYAVEDLRSCANTACHIYNPDNTIKTPHNPGHHSVSKDGW